MDFTAWSNLTTVENRLIEKAIAGLAINHIEFVHIRPLYVVLILIGIFKVDFTAWLNLNANENRLVRLVVNHIKFVHIRPLKVILIQF